MIRCWWIFRPAARRGTVSGNIPGILGPGSVRADQHVALNAPARHRRIGHVIRHHKPALAAALVCAVTAAPLGYGIGSGLWERGYGRSVYGDSTGAGYNSNGVGAGNGGFDAPVPLANQQPPPVREPGTLALFGVGLVAIIIIRRIAR